MIAAPDVAARTVDPSDFLEFATGRLHARFVKSAADLESACSISTAIRIPTAAIASTSCAAEPTPGARLWSG